VFWYCLVYLILFILRVCRVGIRLLHLRRLPMFRLIVILRCLRCSLLCVIRVCRVSCRPIIGWLRLRLVFVFVLCVCCLYYYYSIAIVKATTLLLRWTFMLLVYGNINARQVIMAMRLDIH
jgi:hypothetical protein